MLLFHNSHHYIELIKRSYVTTVTLKKMFKHLKKRCSFNNSESVHFSSSFYVYIYIFSLHSVPCIPLLNFAPFLSPIQNKFPFFIAVKFTKIQTMSLNKICSTYPPLQLTLPTLILADLSLRVNFVRSFFKIRFLEFILQTQIQIPYHLE